MTRSGPQSLRQSAATLPRRFNDYRDLYVLAWLLRNSYLQINVLISGILSGEPLGEPVVMQGPFVMNRTDEIRQAMADFQTGRFGAIPETSPAP